MRLSNHIIGAALVFAIAVGCSKKPNEQTSKLPPNTKDLGVVELEAQTPKEFSLGNNRGCVLTCTPIPGSLDIKVRFVATNADGTVKSSDAQIITSSGQQCAISVDDISVALTPKLKAQ